ncbi:hypothetical protein KZO74_04640 [Prevotella salivae]|uniref:hypothetical protein n=1 Tax=Segatella salivae TaxID=228604 RepID=UPI001C5DE6CA|nr:hypothetical protein [Segatella salivae]MBW4764296.1 hypothetical protein [Segatella salivae]
MSLSQPTGRLTDVFWFVGANKQQNVGTCIVFQPRGSLWRRCGSFWRRSCRFSGGYSA